MYRIFTTLELNRLGYTSADIRFARTCCLKRLSRGVYVTLKPCRLTHHRPLWSTITEGTHQEFKQFGDSRDPIELLNAHVMARSDRQSSEPKDETISHISAALMHGLPIAYPVTHQVEVFRPGINRRFATLQVRGGAIPSQHRLKYRDTMVTTLERTLIDVARSYNLDISVPMIDDALHRGLTTKDAITATLAECAEKRNARKVRLALDLADGKRESPAESVAAVRFYQYGIVGMESQVSFARSDRSQVLRVGFCHRASRLIVEVDGLNKFYLGSGVPRDELEKERNRELWLREQGYFIIRLSWKDLFREKRFEEIKEHLRGH